MKNQVPESEKETKSRQWKNFPLSPPPPTHTHYSSPASFPGQKKFPVPIVTNINFLPTISIPFQEIRLWEIMKWSLKRKCFDLLWNSLNWFFKEMYTDQFGEICMCTLGLKGWKYSIIIYLSGKLCFNLNCLHSRE